MGAKDAKFGVLPRHPRQKPQISLSSPRPWGEGTGTVKEDVTRNEKWGMNHDTPGLSI
jgi:hypothetical protein